MYISALSVQETQYILSNMSDLLFFYQSLFLYSLCLAHVAGRVKAVSVSFLVRGLCEFVFKFWLMKSGADGHSSFVKIQI